jgi:uncharacterized pyridoxamine 5'-phosphate oxidase family protein
VVGKIFYQVTWISNHFIEKMEVNVMQEIIKVLKENPMGNLATVENGKPRVRPWGFMLEEGGQFFFCTNTTKDVYTQLQTTPYIEFTTTTKDMVWVRLNGQIKFSDDLQLKEKVLEANQMVKNIYQTPDNPIFAVFYLEHGTATMADFSGQPPRTFEF